MSDVKQISVLDVEDGIRLDKWFKSHYPLLGFGNLQKLMRTGQIRVNGGRVKPGTRLEEGQVVRVPPFSTSKAPTKAYVAPPKISDKDREEIQDSVLFHNDDLIVINKPPGLAVQGGSGTKRHVDGMLDALKFDGKERPKLVHRLDKDTSGVLVLARNTKSARYLTELFRGKDIRKLYWALTMGVPNPDDGLIDLRLIKAPGKGGERMVVDEDNGKRARTRYKVLDQAGKSASLLALEPLTGRTHQLRVHLSEALSTPIMGDGKYGGADCVLEGGGIERKLHLHARRILIPLKNGKTVDVTAPTPKHVQSSLDYLGFYLKDDYDLFLELE
jgi:23S rRNA pseudouridine955/2504/2580 synthase